MENVPTSRVRSLLRSAAGPLEVVAVVAIAMLAWLLALGWSWSSATDGGASLPTHPQSSADWVPLGVVAVLGVGWLALRGRAVLGTVAVCLPIIVLSGWRMAASGVIGWPTGLSSLIFSLSAICMVTALIGTWLRRVGIEVTET